ncbi:hypothetical protein DJ031_15780 [bacterium endosymbiont of Escarpia laminata]|nr:MAG: hypothetical protein DJ031_15780 [bacterium endosymbiont of Escarpia laminata]
MNFAGTNRFSYRLPILMVKLCDVVPIFQVFWNEIHKKCDGFLRSVKILLPRPLSKSDDAVLHFIRDQEGI